MIGDYCREFTFGKIDIILTELSWENLQEVFRLKL